MLELFGEAGRLDVLGVALAVQHRNREAEQHTCNRRVNARGVHERPRERADRQQNQPRREAIAAEEQPVALRDHPVSGDRHEREAERNERDLIGVEDRDDADRDQVVDHRERQQKDAQRARQARSDEGQHGDRKRDVGGGRNRPAVREVCVAPHDRRIDQRGYEHTTRGRGDRNDRGARAAQIASHELALQLEADKKEEDREQAVSGPRPKAQLEVPGLVADLEVAQGKIRVGDWRVCPEDRDQRRRNQQQAANGLFSEDLADPFRL